MKIEIIKAKDYYDFRTNRLTGTCKVGLCDIEFKIDDTLIRVTTSKDATLWAFDDFYLIESNELVKIKNSTLELLNAELQLFKVKQKQDIKIF